MTGKEQRSYVCSSCPPIHDDQVSAIVTGADFQMDSYSTWDASLGYSREDWTITLFGENLSNELADLFISNEDDIVKPHPTDPERWECAGVIVSK